MKKKLTALMLAIVTVLSFGLFASCGTQKNKIVYAEIALSGEAYGYCVDPSNTALLASVNELLAEIKENGKLDEIYAAEDNGTAGNIGDVKTASTDRENELVVATNAEFEPFEYKQGKYFAGVDMQIAKLLAEKLNKTLVIVDMDFDAVILSVGNGTCDIGMAGLTISDGRAENVTFSNAYYNTTQYIAYVEGDETFASCTTKEQIDDAIKALANGTKAGAATGQTGEAYLRGSEDFEFEGFSNLSIKSYDTLALAVMDLANGNVKFVIGDADPIKACVKSING